MMVPLWIAICKKAPKSSNTWNKRMMANAYKDSVSMVQVGGVFCASCEFAKL